MKITIELDGHCVQPIDLPSAPAMHRPANSEPPPELLAAARAMGAQNAGVAAFSLSPDVLSSFSSVDRDDDGAAPALDAGGAMDTNVRNTQARKASKKRTGRSR